MGSFPIRTGLGTVQHRQGKKTIDGAARLRTFSAAGGIHQKRKASRNRSVTGHAHWLGLTFPTALRPVPDLLPPSDATSYHPFTSVPTSPSLISSSIHRRSIEARVAAPARASPPPFSPQPSTTFFLQTPDMAGTSALRQRHQAVPVIDLSRSSSAPEDVSDSSSSEDESVPTFVPPTFTIKELLDCIPKHCFQRSAIRSGSYVLWDFTLIAGLVYAASFIDSNLGSKGAILDGHLGSAAKIAAWALYSYLTGLVATGVWVSTPIFLARTRAKDRASLTVESIRNPGHCARVRSRRLFALEADQQHRRLVPPLCPSGPLPQVRPTRTLLTPSLELTTH